MIQESMMGASLCGARSHLRMLGGFEVTVDGRHVDIADASQRLLVLLALSGKPQRRTRVAGTLWPEKPEARAAANLFDRKAQSSPSLQFHNNVGRSPAAPFESPFSHFRAPLNTSILRRFIHATL